MCFSNNRAGTFFFPPTFQLVRFLSDSTTKGNGASRVLMKRGPYQGFYLWSAWQQEADRIMKICSALRR